MKSCQIQRKAKAVRFYGNKSDRSEELKKEQKDKKKNQIIPKFKSCLEVSIQIMKSL